MPSNPKVSVMIPTYNYARFLDDAIQSVLAQTFTDFELVVVDNCSTDNTAEVVQKYLDDPHVTFHRNETNLGLVGNWNRCLELARGEYIKLLCADDKFGPQLLERFVAVMDEHRGVSLVSSHNQLFQLHTRVRKAPFTGLVSGQVARENIVLHGGKNWLYNPSAVMFRKADAEKVGLFNPLLISLIDLEYYLRLLTLGDCYIIPETLSFIRSHGETQSAKIRWKKHERTFEAYRFMISVKKETKSSTDVIHSEIDQHIKLRASRCAAVMYKLLPTIYEKKSRALFKTAFQIGQAEGVLFNPITRLLKGEIKIRGNKKLKSKPVLNAVKS